MLETAEITKMTADIVVAYVSHNAISPADVPTMISDVYQALARKDEGRTGVEEGEIAPPESDADAASPAGEAAVEAEAEEAPLRPAVPIERSVHPDFLICLEDGQTFRTLRRHLRSAYNMSPAEYRAKWNLPKDYPMVAPTYAAARSELAKKIGLGKLPTEPSVKSKAAPPKQAARERRAAPAKPRRTTS